MDAGRRGLPVDRLVRGGGAALLGRLLDRGFRRGELVVCRCRIPCTIRRRGRNDSLGERHTGVRLVQRQERPASTAPDSGGRTSRGRAAPGIRSRLVGQPDRTVPRPGMRTCHRPVVENRTDPVHRLALGADVASSAGPGTNGPAWISRISDSSHSCRWTSIRPRTTYGRRIRRT